MLLKKLKKNLKMYIDVWLCVRMEKDDSIKLRQDIIEIIDTEHINKTYLEIEWLIDYLFRKSILFYCETTMVDKVSCAADIFNEIDIEKMHLDIKHSMEPLTKILNCNDLEDKFIKYKKDNNIQDKEHNVKYNFVKLNKRLTELILDTKECDEHHYYRLCYYLSVTNGFEYGTVFDEISVKKILDFMDMELSKNMAQCLEK